MKKVREKALDWNWVKKNFWNVVLILIIWQIIIAIIFAIVTQITGLKIPTA